VKSTWQSISKILFIIALVCFCQPVRAAVVTSDYGWRIHPIFGGQRFHTGVDIGYGYGEPIGAFEDGVVTYAAWLGGYGNCVVVKHTPTDYTLYGHLSRIEVSPGDVVEQGNMIGNVGATGNATGPHLHFEWWHNGEYTDPMPLLQGSSIELASAVMSGMYVGAVDALTDAEPEMKDTGIINALVKSEPEKPKDDGSVKVMADARPKKKRIREREMEFSEEQKKQIAQAKQKESQSGHHVEQVTFPANRKGISFRI
jgi:hypothetical protein